MDMDYGRDHHGDDDDQKIRCTFDQLLCIEFDVIFDVDVRIDEDSIVVTCGDGRHGRHVSEED